MNGNRTSLFRNAGVTIACVLLVVQISAFYLMAGQERTLPNASLQQVPARFDTWKQIGEEGVLDQDIQDLLKADQTLNRTYVDGSGKYGVSLFVAFFKSQRAGVSPHSPKVCLPGSGWMPRDDKTIALTVPTFTQPIPVNRYVVTKGENKSVVLYWYQSFNRVVANEYAAKLYLMLDAVRHRRSDTSLVRVVIPVQPGQSEEEAQRLGEQFVQEFFKPLRTHLPA
jgi:EpsI family protein